VQLCLPQVLTHITQPGSRRLLIRGGSTLMSLRRTAESPAQNTAA
jgi:hypothetical protein